MIYTEYVKIQNIIIHQVGNKLSMDGVKLSNHTIGLTDELNEILVKHFLMSFRNRADMQFKAPLLNNSVYSLVKETFADQSIFIKCSQELAKLLYENSTYSKITNGEFYVVYFKDCVVGSQTSDAIGLFKTEQKTPFLRITPMHDGYSIEEVQGFSLKHFEKACFIFNVDQSSGYQVSVIDKTSKSGDAMYWTDSFLQVKKRKTRSTQTENLFEICKSYVSQLEETDENQKANMVNKAFSMLKESEEVITLHDFQENVFGSQHLVKDFEDFRKNEQSKKKIEIDEVFETDSSSLKKTGLKKLTTIHLDDSFDLTIKENSDLEKGFDEKRQKQFYKLYFNKEK